MEFTRTRTPLSEREVADALRAAYVTVFGQEPTTETLGVGWAQIALENAHGNAIWNNNFGNITTKDPESNYYLLTTDEQQSPGDWKSTTMMYAAHDTPADGAAAYWRFLSSPHFAPALSYFAAGDAPNAARKLHELHYFTANAEPIAASFGKLYDYFVANLAPAMGLPQPKGGPSDQPPQVNVGLSIAVFGGLCVLGAWLGYSRQGEAARRALAS